MAAGVKGPIGDAPVLLSSQPGIQRDGTRLSRLAHTDGEHVRFSDGPPTKMGGRRTLTRELGGISRGLHLGAVNGTNYIHSGASDRVELLRFGVNGSVIAPANRTPVGLVPDDDFIWTFESMFDQVDGSWKIIAHAAPNGVNIDSDAELPAYIGDLTDTAVLTEIPSSETSGGICALHPFMFYFGSAGEIFWSVSNKPGDVTSVSGTGTNIAAGEARITGAKLIAGRSILGTGVPGGLFWSLDTLLRASYVGGKTTWDFDTLASIEILSAKSVVEYNGAYFWIGAERFLAFTGGLKDVPNTFNRKWFFDNLNYTHAAKIFGYAVPSHGEIHWAFPKGSSTECNHEVILHVASGKWWDTPLSGSGRSAGLSPKSTFGQPILAGVDETSNQYRLWQHEIGYDEIDGNEPPRAIRSFYTTADLTFLRADKPSDSSVEILSIEPDFIQIGDLSVTIYGNANSRAPLQVSDKFTIADPGDGVEGREQIVELTEERRQMRLRFESNTLGGHYEAGQVYAKIRPTGTRVTE